MTPWLASLSLGRVGQFVLIILKTKHNDTGTPYYVKCNMNIFTAFGGIIFLAGKIVSNEHYILQLFLSNLTIWSEKSTTHDIGLKIKDIGQEAETKE